MVPLIVFRNSIKYCQFLLTEPFVASKLKVQEKVATICLCCFLPECYLKFTRKSLKIVSNYFLLQGYWKFTTKSVIVNAKCQYLFFSASYWKLRSHKSVWVLWSVVSVDNTDYHTCLWKFFLPNPFQTKCIQIFSLPDKKLDSSNYSSQNQ